MMWKVIKLGKRVAVVPNGDEQPHSDFELTCNCNPRVEGMILIHNAFDGREELEAQYGSGNRLPSSNSCVQDNSHEWVCVQ